MKYAVSKSPLKDNIFTIQFTNILTLCWPLQVAAVLLLACAVSAQIAETPEVAAARAAHMAAHAAARGWVLPYHYGGQYPMDTPEVYAAKMEHFRAYSDAAAKNGVVSNIAWNHPYYYGYNGAYVPMDTPEVHAAKVAHFAAHAAARVGQ